jgi:hypothetical protein
MILKVLDHTFLLLKEDLFLVINYNFIPYVCFLNWIVTLSKPNFNQSDGFNSNRENNSNYYGGSKIKQAKNHLGCCQAQLLVADAFPVTSSSL